MSAAVIDAVNWVALWYVVVRLLPFQSTGEYTVTTGKGSLDLDRYRKQRFR
jgi:hypothetical protein